MNNLSFAPGLVGLIKDGSKTLTYRLGDKYNSIQIEDHVEVIDSSTNKPFGIIEITDKSYTHFIDLPIDRSDHETYKSKEEMRKTFSGYYKQPMLDHYKFLVLGFKVIKIY